MMLSGPQLSSSEGPEIKPVLLPVWFSTETHWWVYPHLSHDGNTALACCTSDDIAHDL
eukprot:CAMPEP_0173394402 /NCGR_PEP_ID=MMETSP1356-20130122/27229_1 /TAXON_ID=77927 ORGANISM="Hemiselmis virescens, Strain PCC157" /NCGR_SAMPLE_ID=MMETSP1356 /ASSEMBLY_ACC=CAM_ASM_000847 /LENGTH=57 /DNA_ID=CAMNT_0014352751 /DNA_START=275 /DNA_END=445 /DNA_ORIENTATION=-